MSTYFAQVCDTTSSGTQPVPREVALLTNAIFKALGQETKPLMLVNEDSAVVSSFLHQFLAPDWLERGVVARICKPSVGANPFGRIAEALSALYPGLTTELLEATNSSGWAEVLSALDPTAAGQSRRVLFVDGLEQFGHSHPEDLRAACELLASLATRGCIQVVASIDAMAQREVLATVEFQPLIGASVFLDLQTGTIRQRVARPGQVEQPNTASQKNSARTVRSFIFGFASASALGAIAVAALVSGQFDPVEDASPYAGADSDAPATAVAPSQQLLPVSAESAERSDEEEASVQEE